MYDVVDLRSVDWTSSVGNTGTDGCYLKCKLKERNNLYYVKLSSFDRYAGFIGYESVNEVIASRLGKKLGIPVATQILQKVLISVYGQEYVTYASFSPSYKQNGDERISAEDYYKMFKKDNTESPLNTFNRMGFGNIVSATMLFDFLIIGRDRHGANIELLKNKGKYRPAPLFDNGISFLAPIVSSVNPDTFHSMITSFDEKKDYTVNNFFGYKSLQDNLSLAKTMHVNKLNKEDRKSLMYNLSKVIPDYYRKKVWDIIWYRYNLLVKGGKLVEK